MKRILMAAFCIFAIAACEKERFDIQEPNPVLDVKLNGESVLETLQIIEYQTSVEYEIEYSGTSRITATPPNAEMHKTALGAENTVDWKYCKNTQDAVNELHEAGYTVLSIEQCEGSTMLGDMVLDRDKKYAIVMGNEVKGVKQEVVDMCDGCIEIPQYGTKHSLNVSVTAGIVLWEFANKLMEFRNK